MIPFHCQSPINLSISPSIEHRRFKRGTASIRLRSEGSWTSHNGVFCKLSGGRDDFLGGRHDGILAFGNSNLKRALRFSYDVLHAVVFLLDNLAPPWLTPNGRKWLGFKPALTEEAGMPSFAAAPEDRDSRCSSLYQVRTPLAASEGQLSYDRSIHLGQSGGA